VVIDRENPSPSPSISLGAIEQLPRDEYSNGFDSHIEIAADQPQSIPMESEAIDIDTGEDTEEKLPDDNSLDSFIRKLPK